MIGWHRAKLEEDTWHLTSPDWATVTLCDVVIAQGYVQRDPHKVDQYGGTKCRKCWTEWRLRDAASLAHQDQAEAQHAEQ